MQRISTVNTKNSIVTTSYDSTEALKIAYALIKDNEIVSTLVDAMMIKEFFHNKITWGAPYNNVNAIKKEVNDFCAIFSEKTFINEEEKKYFIDNIIQNKPSSFNGGGCGDLYKINEYVYKVGRGDYYKSEIIKIQFNQFHKIVESITLDDKPLSTWICKPTIIHDRILKMNFIDGISYDKQSHIIQKLLLINKEATKNDAEKLLKEAKNKCDEAIERLKKEGFGIGDDKERNYMFDFKTLKIIRVDVDYDNLYQISKN